MYKKKLKNQETDGYGRDKGPEVEQEIWANAHETRYSISLISYAGCLGLSPVGLYFSENSLLSGER